MRAEWIPASFAAVASFQGTLRNSGFQPVGVLIEVQAQRTLLELSGGGRHALITIEEVAGHAGVAG